MFLEEPQCFEQLLFGRADTTVLFFGEHPVFSPRYLFGKLTATRGATLPKPDLRITYR